MRAVRRIAFVPKPSGFRFYHTHVVAGGDLNRGTYTGQAGPVYIEPKNNPGAFDREVFLVMKEFAPARAPNTPCQTVESPISRNLFFGASECPSVCLVEVLRGHFSSDRHRAKCIDSGAAITEVTTKPSHINSCRTNVCDPDRRGH
jgi:hypothetical protein